MIILLYFRYHQRNIDNSVDESMQTPADYTILVKNIPTELNLDYITELNRKFTHQAVPPDKLSKAGIKQLEITNIVLVYKIEEIEK